MDYLKSTELIDYNTIEIQNIIEEFKTGDSSDKQKAIALYLKIRDGRRYNPYKLCFEADCYKASNIAKKKDGHCIEKSILLTACLRAVNIPARIHLAKVKNHIGVERLIEKFGTNELTPHGMVDLFLDGKWLKVSPAFNIELCERYNIAPLDFDGENDSVFHEFDKAGNVFMEYLEDYGHFEDVPVEFIFENFKSNYPAIYQQFKGHSKIKL
jgi:transglutaminase-like putative cysteine protease